MKIPSAYIRIAALASRPYRPATATRPERPATNGLVPASAATIWRWCKEGRFPRPVQLSPGITAWRTADVQTWLDAH